MFSGARRVIIVTNITVMSLMRRSPISPISLISGVSVGLFVVVVFSLQVATAIARGYMSNDSGLQTGMVAALSADSTVERATQETANRVVGVVTTIDNSLVTVSSGSAEVLVENEGQAETYVSDANGEVKQGDLLVLSPFKGILMKAGDTAATVIGIASEVSTDATTYPYESKGNQKETQIVKAKVNLNYQGSSMGTAANDSTLAKLGRRIMGREVSEARVLVALIIFIIVLMAEGGIIYGAVSSAITSLGRNPMAKKIIRSELSRIIIIAIVVLVLGLSAVYIVLKV